MVKAGQKTYPNLNTRMTAEQKAEVEAMASRLQVSNGALVRAALHHLCKMKNLNERGKIVHSYIGGPGARSERNLWTPEEKATRDRTNIRRRALAAERRAKDKQEG